MIIPGTRVMMSLPKISPPFVDLVADAGDEQG